MRGSACLARHHIFLTIVRLPQQPWDLIHRVQTPGSHPPWKVPGRSGACSLVTVRTTRLLEGWSSMLHSKTHNTQLRKITGCYVSLAQQHTQNYFLDIFYTPSHKQKTEISHTRLANKRLSEDKEADDVLSRLPYIPCCCTCDVTWWR